MPRILLLSIVLFAFFASSAQTRFSVFAGPQVITAGYSIRGYSQSTDPKIGVQVGLGAKVEFDNQLYFSPAIYYSLKGYNVSFDQAANPPDVSAVNNNVTTHTLETAFLLQYDFKKTANHFFVKLGPSLDFQLYGKEKFQTVDGGIVKRTMKYDFSDYGRYAASAVIHFGYETASNYVFYLHYAQGLTNLSNADGGPAIQYRVAGITIGKYFR